MGDWEGVRLHVVTGKGGTGKTTTAAGLALALATGGHRVLLAEVEGRQGLAQLFDSAPLAYEERRIASAPGGGEVLGLAIDAREAMHEYLAMYYRLGRAGKALDKLGFVDFATTIAPGLRDVLLTGKIYEATRRKDESGAFVYDAVVVDAPPTGRVAKFLDVSSSVTSLARVGPINRQASAIIDLVHSPRTAVHIVTILEEMPVQEASDAVRGLRETSIPLGAIIVNQVREPHLRVSDLSPARKGGLDQEELAAGLKAAGLPADGATVERLLDDASYHAERMTSERRQRKVINGLGLPRLASAHPTPHKLPVYDIPRSPSGIDLAALYEVADALVRQGATGSKP